MNKCPRNAKRQNIKKSKKSKKYKKYIEYFRIVSNSCWPGGLSQENGIFGIYKI